MGVQLQCCASIIKYLFFFFNLIFVLFGLAVTAVGAVALHFQKVDSTVNVGLGLVVAVGVIVFLRAFLGCCGAIQQNRCMLFSFIAFLPVIIVLLAVGIYLINANYDDLVTNLLQKVFDNAKTSTDTEAKEVVDAIQHVFSCCGYNGYADWVGAGIPQSCCTSFSTSTSTATTCAAAHAFDVGCKSQVSSWVGIFAKVLTGFGITIIFFECIGAGIALYLTHKLRVHGGGSSKMNSPNPPAPSVPRYA